MFLFGIVVVCVIIVFGVNEMCILKEVIIYVVVIGFFMIFVLLVVVFIIIMVVGIKCMVVCNVIVCNFKVFEVLGVVIDICSDKIGIFI